MSTVRIERVSKEHQELYHKSLNKPKGLKYEIVAREGKLGSPVLESHLAKNKLAAKRIQASLKQKYRVRTSRKRKSRCHKRR